jgi:glycosyltransferase involved in cell wall biosynthesis
MVSFALSSVFSSKRLTRGARQLVMLGTSMDTKGGISSVVRLYMSGGLFCSWNATYIPTHCDGNFAKKVAMAASAWLKVGLLLRRDIVLHIHSASRASFWRKCFFIVPAVLARRPVIFHLHGAEFAEFYKSECGPFRKSVVRWILNHCSTIVVLSTFWRSFLEGVTRVHIEVIPNPAVDLSSHFGPTPTPFTLLFLGRLGRRKGIFTLLESLVNVVRRFPKTSLLCGGDGDIDLAREHATALGVDRNVKFLGWVDGDEKVKLLRSSTIYVLPSFAEGVPISVLEAMSAGLPVVSTTVGGIPDVITTGVEGILVPPGDITALTSAICSLLESAELRHRLAQNAHARFKREFSLESVMGRLESMYGAYKIPSSRPAT